MPFGWVAAATAAAGLLSANSSQEASGQQSSAAKQATGIQQNQFQTIQNTQAPVRMAGNQSLQAIQAGFGQQQDWKTLLKQGYADVFAQHPSMGPQALDALNKQIDAASSPSDTNTPGGESVMDFARRMGVPSPANMGDVLAAQQKGAAGGDGSVGGVSSGQFTHQFNANDLTTSLAPNYDFMLKQGQGATTNLNSATGGLLSGNTLKAISDYTTNYAGNAYQQAFQNYNTNQSNIFNRLASVAGLAQTGNTTSAQAGTATSAGIANTTQAAGAAQAAGTVGTSNALGGGLTNAASWYALPQMMNSGKNPNAGAGLNT